MSSPILLSLVVARGDWGTVECVVRQSGASPAWEFLTELMQLREKGVPSGSAEARFLVLFQTMATYGRIQGKRFKAEMSDFWAFSHEVKNRQIRFPCFRDGNKWILTHGFFKPGAKKKLGRWPTSEIERAERLREEYFRRKRETSEGGS